jgi:hypothetical protein
MNKHELFPILDIQGRQINQIVSLSKVLQLAGSFDISDKDALKDCVCIISDIGNSLRTNQLTISQSFIELHAVNNAVNGNSD